MYMYMYVHVYRLHFAHHLYLYPPPPLSILAFNKGFLALLHSRLTDWGPDVSIGDIFIGMVSHCLGRAHVHVWPCQHLIIYTVLTTMYNELLHGTECTIWPWARSACV